MAVMGRPRKFGKTTTFGFDLDVSMKKDIEAITKKLNKEQYWIGYNSKGDCIRLALEERKYSKGDCIRLALQYWMDSGYPIDWNKEKR